VPEGRLREGRSTSGCGTLIVASTFLHHLVNVSVQHGDRRSASDTTALRVSSVPQPTPIPAHSGICAKTTIGVLLP